MKKFFFLPLAAAALLTGCSSDDTLEVAQTTPQAIEFDAFVDKSTRADVAYASTIGAIEVYGWKTPTGDDAVQIFDAQKVTVSTEGIGSYTPIQYWEADCTYNFEAIYPVSADDNDVTFTGDINGGTITFTNDAETDLIYSKASQVTTSSSIDESPGTVTFTFQHMLARVVFTFTNAFPSDAAATITVTDVKITNAYASGSISPNTTDAAWTNLGTNNLNVSFASDNVASLASGGGSASTEHMYLIPVSNASYTVTFTVSMSQGSGDPVEYKHTATITTPMEKGKSYNFTASINDGNITDDGLFPINFTAVVGNWDAYSSTTVSSTITE